MKKTTLIIWVIIIGIIALVIFQNQTFFLANQSLRINLGVVDAYNAPELPIAILFLFFFFSGVIIAYLFNLSARFKAIRAIKKLNATLASHKDELNALKSEIAKLKGEDIAAASNAGSETTVLEAHGGVARDESAAENTETLSVEPYSANPAVNGEESSSEKNQS